ncbi:MAG: 16S rRNA (guanine(966)-N(2))-methyltransferase RsmD [Rhodocyclaceae bacterium]|nr:16S rRNA (guanine(966)-N(2))-methyltransferase RsmD [Rhodocyclaceae bacterium]
MKPAASTPRRAGAANRLRIVGGEWRSRVLQFPDALGLRPTPDRVRETLFNWLGQDLTGLACVDLFAGSGALGLEAASRGAARVVLVESNPRVADALQSNIRLLRAEGRVELYRQDALKFASLSSCVFDVAFLDPPYGKGWLDKLAPLLPRFMKEDAVLYVESEVPLQALGDWRTARSGRAGQVFFHLMRREGSQDA